jgi:hypothetical protein
MKYEADRNIMISNSIIIYDRNTSKKYFSRCIKDESFLSTMIRDINIYSEIMGAVKKVEKIGSNQIVICIDVGNFIEEKLYSDTEEVITFGQTLCFLIRIADITFLVNELGQAIPYSKELIYEAFELGKDTTGVRTSRLFTAFETSAVLLSYETKRHLKKTVKIPKKHDKLEDIFLKEDNKKENREFTKKIKNSIYCLDNEELDIDLFYSKVMGKLEPFQVYREREGNGIVIKRVKNNTVYKIYKKKDKEERQ